MIDVFKRNLFFAVCLSLGSSAASAETFTCEYQNEDGKAYNVRFLNRGFIVDTEKGLVTIVYEYGEDTSYKVKAKVTENFTTYSFRKMIGKARTQFSFRVYKTGICTGTVRASGYSSILARGILK